MKLATAPAIPRTRTSNNVSDSRHSPLGRVGEIFLRAEGEALDLRDRTSRGAPAEHRRAHGPFGRIVKISISRSPLTRSGNRGFQRTRAAISQRSSRAAIEKGRWMKRSTGSACDRRATHLASRPPDGQGSLRSGAGNLRAHRARPLIQLPRAARRKPPGK